MREHVADGKSLDEIASLLIERGFGPITTIKAMRFVTGRGLDELKPIVDRALPSRWQAENRRMRDLAEASLTMDDNDKG